MIRSIRPLRFALWIGLLGLSACSMSTVGRVDYEENLPEDQISGFIDRAATPDGVVAHDYLWGIAPLYAFDEKVIISRSPAGYPDQIRIESWDSLVLGLFYRSHRSAVWDREGRLLYEHGDDESALGIVHRRIWGHERPRLNAESYGSVALGLGLLAFGHDENGRTYIRLGGWELHL